MEVLYCSTRGGQKDVTASQAVLQGLSHDGGLFVPQKFPVLDVSLKELSEMTYQQVAYEVMKLFLTDYTEEELKACIGSAYDSKFDTEEIVPIAKLGSTYHLELFHGKTIAFKDMALSILPYLMVTAARKNHCRSEIVILTATSGDTGKATLAGFADVPGTRIIVFYPKNGVSPIQEKQMVTQKGKNTLVVGINGNFDDAQTGVMKMFGDKELEKELAEKGFQFSSANSINIGRLVPQIVYYVYSYAQLLKEEKIEDGESINVVVPTGNFGNILAAYYAKHMGVPVNKLICASNINNVLTDFINTGVYDRNRQFYATVSPSMDILISSNLERLLYLMTDKNDAVIREWFGKLASEGRYEVNAEVKAKLKEGFAAGFCDDSQTKATIHAIYEKYSYTCDTHTAVAVKVYNDYKSSTGDTTKTVIASTASPYKFSAAVLEALEGRNSDIDEYDKVGRIAELSNIPVPAALAELRNKPERFNDVIDKSEQKEYVLRTLSI